MTFRFVHLTDPHLADRPTANRTQSYPDDIKRKFSEVVDLCLAEQRHMVMTGDLFDQKTPSRVSHALVQWTIDELRRVKQAGLSVFAIAGNHDLSEEGLDSLPRQPFGVLIKAGVLDFLAEVTVVEFDGFRVQFTPFNYHEDGDQFISAGFFRNERLPDVDAHVILTHAALVPDGQVYPFPTLNYSDFPVDGVDVVFCGHMHHEYPLSAVRGCTFVQFGSLARRSRIQRRDVRVGVGEITTEGVAISSYTLQSQRPWQEVFEDDSELIEVLNNDELSALAREARSLLGFEDVDFGQLLEALAPSLRPGTVQRVRRYMEEAEHEAYA